MDKIVSIKHRFDVSNTPFHFELKISKAVNKYAGPIIFEMAYLIENLNFVNAIFILVQIYICIDMSFVISS